MGSIAQRAQRTTTSSKSSLAPVGANKSINPDKQNNKKNTNIIIACAPRRILNNKICALHGAASKANLPCVAIITPLNNYQRTDNQATKHLPFHETLPTKSAPRVAPLINQPKATKLALCDKIHYIELLTNRTSRCGFSKPQNDKDNQQRKPVYNFFNNICALRGAASKANLPCVASFTPLNY
jgi:hypothetical protein